MSTNKTAASLFTAICVSFATSAQAEMPHKDLSMERHAENALMQPVKDVNLRKDQIPEKLLAVQNHPYDLENMRGCRALEAEITQLDELLGPDINQLQEKSLTEKREQGVSRVAGAMIGGLIPFRGVVRELSGANAAKRRFLEAIAAGNARRSFLKGVAVTKGCLTAPQPRVLALAYNFQGF
ncbi:hypothetical protein [Parasphingorhabdus cellanae]|uniref:Uncharacterized protein n=1 Tax=Parasphingorhabdus cellanae TaxID=2806553 RepID=A0ABX7T4W7_9SPHN|nr:hypothetical protein [Parasphingorhabdus cellanae]QTD56644.1 hypothetical protein J4G78_03370 [Parasphingorhabdus cellanae]